MDLEKIVKNPFKGIPDLAENPEHRRPFSIEQLAKILEIAKADPLLYPIVVTAMSTSMRLGDCCCLKWSSVNELIQQIEVPAVLKSLKPAKVPYFGLMDAVLQQAKLECHGSDYVFPQAQQYYVANMAEIYQDRLERVLLMAGFTNDDNSETSIRITRPGGGRKASLRGFHSFKTTWITIALSNGVPIEIVKKITGNQSVDIVLDNYFQPGIKEMRSLIQAKLPGVITDGGDTIHPRIEAAPERHQLWQLVETMDGKNWRERRVELLRILA